MATFMPPTGRPDAGVDEVDASDGLQTVPSGEWWLVKAITPTGHNIQINGVNCQSRQAVKVNASFSSSTPAAMYTVPSDYVFEGTLTVSCSSGVCYAGWASNLNTVHSHRMLSAVGGGVENRSVPIKLAAGDAIYGYNSTNTNTNGGATLVGYEFVDGPRYGEYHLDVGDTIQIFDSAGFASTGAKLVIEKHNIA